MKSVKLSYARVFLWCWRPKDCQRVQRFLEPLKQTTGPLIPAHPCETQVYRLGEIAYIV